MGKVCFVISPIGDDDSTTRKRADFVLETYIKPACAQVGYEAVRSDDQPSCMVADGITAALQNAPMAIAYLGVTEDEREGEQPGGERHWNSNVMIEVGYRLAYKLPLVFV